MSIKELIQLMLALNQQLSINTEKAKISSAEWELSKRL